MRKLIIFGTGLMAQIAHFYFRRDSRYETTAFAVDGTYKTSDEFCGVPVVVFDSIEQTHPPDKYDIFIAVGAGKMNSIREAKFYEAKKKGYQLAVYKSPSAICDSPVGENTFIGDMAIVHPFVEIGNNNLIWEYALIGNNSKVGSHGYFAPRSVVSTFVTIEDNVILGTGAIVKTRVRVAKKTLAGASCYISTDTKENSVYGEKCSLFLGCISDKVEIS